MNRKSEDKLARADRAAILSCCIGLTGVASYVAFAFLQEHGFESVCRGSWEERLMLVLRDLPPLASVIALVLGLFAFWLPTGHRVLAAIGILCSIFCATALVSLGLGIGAC